MNPTELRQTFNAISRNFESANETAQVGIYSFTQTYVDPCLSGFKACLYDYTTVCFPNRDDHLRRRRGQSRGRADFDFDFYDDWEEDEAYIGGGTGWNNDELDSLLAGRGATQPGRQRAMSYGARARLGDPDSDPTVIPKSSYLGFLDRLPFRIGSRGLKYKPSAAGLQENPGGLRIRDVEAEEPLIEEDEEAEERSPRKKGHARQRSGTEASRSTTTTRSARSDLIMSDEEDDAVPLDDEFAVMLSRRTTTTSSEDQKSGKSRQPSQSRRPDVSRFSSRTVSSRSAKSNKSRRSSSKKSDVPMEPSSEDANLHPTLPSMIDLKREEEELREQEEMEIIQKREAAFRLAQATGFSSPETKSPVLAAMSDSEVISQSHTPSRTSLNKLSLASPLPANDDASDTEPFPEFSIAQRELQSENEPP